MEIGLVEVLLIFITIFIALGASFILPDRRAIIKGDSPKYTSGKKNAVYGIAALVFIMTLIYLLVTINKSGTINLLTAINGIFFTVMGVGLILVNRSIVETLKDKSMTAVQGLALPTVQPSVPVDMAGSGLDQNVQSTQGASQEIKVTVRKPMEAGYTPPARPSGSTMKVACPKCSGVITIDRSQPASTIQCPFCGFQGNLG